MLIHLHHAAVTAFHHHGAAARGNAKRGCARVVPVLVTVM
jgi:hypothetical protein